MMLAHTKSYLSLLYSSDSLITFHSKGAIFMTLEYHAWRGGRGSISKMLRTGAKLSPVGSRNRETSLVISLGWPSKPDNQAPWWGIQGVCALLRNTGAFTSGIHSVISLVQPRRSQQWGRMWAAYQRQSLAWRLLVGAFRLNLKARPWSKRITAFYVHVDHSSKLERCLWWLVCLWTWRVGLPSTPVHVCTRTRTEDCLTL